MILMQTKRSITWLTVEIPAGAPVEKDDFGLFYVKACYFSDMTLRNEATRNGCPVEADNVTEKLFTGGLR
jgi:hypothetical protein